MQQKWPCILHRQFGFQKDCYFDLEMNCQRIINRHHNHVHSLQFSQLAINILQCNRNDLASFVTNMVIIKTVVVVEKGVSRLSFLLLMWNKLEKSFIVPFFCNRFKFCLQLVHSPFRFVFIKLRERMKWVELNWQLKEIEGCFVLSFFQDVSSSWWWCGPTVF